MTGLQKKFLEFYRDYYSLMEPQKRLETADDELTGQINLNESYLIKDFWTVDTEKGSLTGSFYANSISNYFTKPEQETRSSPYFIRHSVNINQTITVILPDDNWEFDEEVFEDNNTFLKYKQNVKYDGDKQALSLFYEYKSFTDHIPGLQ